MERVRVDFSTTVRGGMIRASQRRASATLYKGDEVEAYDPGEGLAFTGVVDHLSDDGRFAFLRMNWENNSVPQNKPGHNLFVASLGAAPIVVQTTTGELGEGRRMPEVRMAPTLATPGVPQPA